MSLSSRTFLSGRKCAYFRFPPDLLSKHSYSEVIARVISANAPAKLPANLGITLKTVEDSNQSFPSARFTGVDQDFHLLLTINWYALTLYSCNISLKKAPNRYPNGRKPNNDQQLNANAVLRANKLG